MKICWNKQGVKQEIPSTDLLYPGIPKPRLAGSINGNVGRWYLSQFNLNDVRCKVDGVVRSPINVAESDYVIIYDNKILTTFDCRYDIDLVINDIIVATIPANTPDVDVPFISDAGVWKLKIGGWTYWIDNDHKKDWGNIFKIEEGLETLNAAIISSLGYNSSGIYDGRFYTEFANPTNALEHDLKVAYNYKDYIGRGPYSSYSFRLVTDMTDEYNSNSLVNYWWSNKENSYRRNIVQQQYKSDSRGDSEVVMAYHDGNSSYCYGYLAYRITNRTSPISADYYYYTLTEL